MILLNKIKVAFWLIIVMNSLAFTDYPTSAKLKTLRKSFIAIEGNGQKAKTVYQAFIKLNDTSNTVLAYAGTLEAILANEQSNPFSKLSWFNKGKKKIEKAIKNEPNNPELRFLRLTVQQNAPSFLFYNSSIQDDIDFILNHLKILDELNLKKDVELFLMKECSLSEHQKQKLK